jgi:hypothetical protein
VSDLPAIGTEYVSVGFKPELTEQQREDLRAAWRQMHCGSFKVRRARSWWKPWTWLKSRYAWTVTARYRA